MIWWIILRGALGKYVGREQMGGTRKEESCGEG
jgi:hypothetical protein